MRNTNLHMRRTLTREISKCHRQNRSNSGGSNSSQNTEVENVYGIHEYVPITLNPKNPDFENSVCIYGFPIIGVILGIVGVIIWMIL